ncbi:MAG: phage major capsid protein [Desulfosarcina sp.]|nr:phage major capsid protein [Desulfobacterales bacterium]
MADYHILSAIQDTLKIVYGEGIVNQFADETTLYNLFSKSSRKPSGLGYQFSLRNARAQGVGARKESIFLPEALVGKTDKSTILPKYNYGTLRLSGPMIYAAKGNVGAFVDGLADSVDDIYKSIVTDLNRQCAGDGFGLLATLSAASDVLSVAAEWDVTCDNTAGIQRCIEGMVVDFYTSAGAIDQSSVASRIVNVDPATNVITMEANTGAYMAKHPIEAARSYVIVAEAVPDAARVVRYGAREASHATTNTPIEMTGLDGIFDDGTLLATFQDITVASSPKWRANRIHNSATPRALSLDLMLQSIDVSRVKSGKKIQTMILGVGQRRKYANLLIGDVRFAPTTLKGGYEVLTFSAGDGSIEMVVAPDVSPGKIFFMPNGVIKKYELTPLGWGNLDQQMHQRSGYDEWDQFLRVYSNLGCEERNSLTLLTDLIEPDLY